MEYINLKLDNCKLDAKSLYDMMKTFNENDRVDYCRGAVYNLGKFCSQGTNEDTNCFFFTICIKLIFVYLNSGLKCKNFDIFYQFFRLIESHAIVNSFQMDFSTEDITDMFEITSERPISKTGYLKHASEGTFTCCKLLGVYLYMKHHEITNEELKYIDNMFIE